MHYDSLQNLYTIVSMFYPLQSFGYQSRLISSYLCMLSLLGLNYVGSEHDTDSPCTNTYPLQFSHRGANNSGIATSVLTLKQNPHFHTMISV